METNITNKYKSFTSIEQSEKLTRILPLESADMKWFIPSDNEGEFIEEVSLVNNKSEYNLFDKVTYWDDTPYVPCWSLAALLNYLKIKNRFPEINVMSDGHFKLTTYIWDGTDCTQVSIGDNLVDACYEMIVKLNELKIL